MRRYRCGQTRFVRRGLRGEVFSVPLPNERFRAESAGKRACQSEVRDDGAGAGAALDE
jgi:hypothetical protein